MFSILILTLNEEINIAECIRSVSWCNDIVVLDSFSKDKTTEIAASLGAKVYYRKFDNFGSHRNYAINEIQFKNDWVFHLDADERFNDSLRDECFERIKENNKSAFFVPNKIFFFNKWIKYCTQYPYPQVRLIKLGEFFFENSGHGQKESFAKKGIGNINMPYNHLNFSKGLEDWFDKHNKYSTKEAIDFLQIINGDNNTTNLTVNKSINQLRKRKQIFNRLPFKPFFKFVYLYFVKLGFLDGKAGFRYCILQSIYAYMIEIKIKELKNQKQNRPIKF